MTSQETSSIETMVREYTGKRARDRFTDDFKRLAQEGWRVTSQNTVRPRIGCMRWLMLGFLALIFRPHEVLVVTYERARSTASAGSPAPSSF